MWLRRRRGERVTTGTVVHKNGANREFNAKLKYRWSARPGWGESFLYKVANAEEEEGFGNKSTSLRGRRRERNCSKRTKRSVEEKKARERNADALVMPLLKA